MRLVYLLTREKMQLLLMQLLLIPDDVEMFIHSSLPHLPVLLAEIQLGEVAWVHCTVTREKGCQLLPVTLPQ